MQKVTIVKIGFILLFLLLNCKAQQNDDKILFKLVMKDLKYDLKDSVFLNSNANNKAIIDFFRIRNTEEMSFRLTNKDRLPFVKDDSLFIKYDSVIYSPIALKGNSYIFNGKGLSDEAEKFLQDSFNYKFDSIHWDYTVSEYNIYKEDELKNGNKLKISKPVFNLNKNKAILTRSLESSNKKWISDRGFYLFEKKDNDWNLVFKQLE
jgi:hypothetical protein